MSPIRSINLHKTPEQRNQCHSLEASFIAVFNPFTRLLAFGDADT